MSSNFNIINMDSFDSEIIRLKTRISLLEKIKQKKLENDKNNSVLYNLQQVDKILEWNDIRGVLDDNGKEFRNINDMRRYILYGNKHYSRSGRIDSSLQETHWKYNMNGVPQTRGLGGYALLDMFHSISTSLKLLNEKVERLEQLEKKITFDSKSEESI